MPRARGRAACSSSTTRASRCSAAGRSTAGPQYFAYDMAWHLGHDTAGDERVGHARHVRGRSRPRAAARQQVRPEAPLLGPAQAQARAGDRLRRRAPARLRAAPGPRPDEGLRLRQLRDQPEGPVLLDLAVAPRQRRPVGGQEGHRDPRRARRSGPSAAAAEGLQGRARRSSPTSTCRSTTASSTSRAGAPATCSSTTSRDPFHPKLTGKVRIGGIVARAAHPVGLPARSTAARRWSR